MAKILLIAGHGKNHNGTYDPGAVSKFGKEAEYNRDLVTMVTKAIGTSVSFDVYDMNKNCYSYSKAGHRPDYSKYDIVAEVHFNAKAKKDESGDGKITGIGAYVHPNNTKGKALAEELCNKVAALGFKKWQVATSTGLYNLNRAQAAGVTYFLLETAFIDDGDDMTWYNAHKAEVAREFANVLIKAAGGTVSATTPSTNKTTTVKTKDLTPGMYKVNVDDLNIRKGSGTIYKVVDSIRDKGTYTITEMKGSWGKLKSDIGWINCGTKYCTRVGDIVEKDAEPEDNVTPVFAVQIISKDLNIRKGAGTNTKKLGFIQPGVYTIVEVKTTAGLEWGKLKSGAGWIALKYTKKL